MPTKKKKALTIGIPVAIFAIILASALGIFAYATSLKTSDTIFPGLEVAGVAVGGLTVDEAIEAVNLALSQKYGEEDLVVSFTKGELVLSGAELDVSYDVEGAVNQAWEEGREGSVFDALTRSITSESEVVMIVDHMSFNEDYLDQALLEAQQSTASEKVNSSYEINGDEFTIYVGTSARFLDIEPLKEQIVVALYANNYETIAYDYEETPYESVDMTAIYQQLCVAVEDAYYDEETKTVVAEVIGYGFDVEAANQKQLMASEGETLTFQLEQILPEVTIESLEESLFNDVLGEYSDSHVWNTARTTNLELAAEAINGQILNPGEIFSFNDTVGERTADKGYQAASVYVSGNTEAQLGGGVCQVASTMYMATLLADLEVTERTEHMFLVTYVPMGMDATIYWGSLDYCFKNTSEYPIRIETTVEDGYVTCKLWGTQTADRFVEMSYTVISTTAWEDVIEEDETKPAEYSEVTQTAYTGYKVQTYKQYVDAEGNVLTEKEKVAYSNYQVRNRITTVGLQPEEEVLEDGTVVNPDGTVTDTTTDVTTDVTTDTSTDVTTDTTPDTTTDTTVDTSTDTTDTSTDTSTETTETTTTSPLELD